jgi:hypothetical protein
MSVTGEYFAQLKSFAMFKHGETSDRDFPGDVNKQMEGTAIHELAHGLLAYALPGWVSELDYWRTEKTKSNQPGAEAPPTDYGTTNAAEDLCESVMLYFLARDRLKNGTSAGQGDVAGPCPTRHKLVGKIVRGWKPKVKKKKKHKHRHHHRPKKPSATPAVVVPPAADTPPLVVDQSPPPVVDQSSPAGNSVSSPPAVDQSPPPADPVATQVSDPDATQAPDPGAAPAPEPQPAPAPVPQESPAAQVDNGPAPTPVSSDSAPVPVVPAPAPQEEASALSAEQREQLVTWQVPERVVAAVEGVLRDIQSQRYTQAVAALKSANDYWMLGWLVAQLVADRPLCVKLLAPQERVLVRKALRFAKKQDPAGVQRLQYYTAQMPGPSTYLVYKHFEDLDHARYDNMEVK